MPKLVFRVDVDTSPVKKFRTEIEQIEKTMVRIKGENFSFDHWLREFDRLKTELEKKKEQIANIKKELLSINPISNPKATLSLEKEYAQAKKDQESLVHETVNLSNKFGKAYDDLVATLEKAQKVTDGVTAKLIEQKNVVANLQSEVRILNAEYRNADKDKKAEILTQKTSKTKELEQELITLNALRAEQERAKLSVKSLSDETRNYEKVVGKVSGAQAEANLVMNRFEGALLKIGGLATLQRFASDVIRVRGEFQKTQVAFETMLGSKAKAETLMSQMVQTAAKTPFDLQGVADGAKQLLAYGTSAENVNDTLVRLGNIASGLSIPLGDMVYLYGTTQTQGRLFTQDVRQFMGRGIPLVKELASMLGKTEQEINKMVTAGQIGFPEVEKVIKKMTDEGGRFYNLMQKQSETLSGQISNLGDAWDGMLNSIGEDTQSLSSKTISMATIAVEHYEEIGRILIGLISTYGAYRAATIAYYAISKTYGVYDIATKELQFAATVKNIAATKAMTVQQALLNKTMLANPYVLVTTLIVGASAAMWILADHTSAAEKAQKRFDEQKEQSVKKEQEHKQRLEELVSAIQNEYTSSMDRVKAMKAIKDEYPALFQKYIDEKGHIKDLIALWKEYNEETGKEKVKENKSNYSNSQKLISEYEQVIGLWKRFGEDPNFHKNSLNESEKQLADKYKNETLSTLKSKLDEERNVLRNYQKEVRSDELAQWQLDLKKNTDVQLKVELDEMKRLQQARKNNKWYSLNVGVGSLKGATTESELQNRIDILESELKSRKISTYQEDFEAAKKAWEDAKKKLSEIEKDKSKFTSKQYEEAKKRKETAEKKYKDLGGITGSSLTKQESQAEKLRKQTDKYNVLLDKQALEQKRSVEDLQMKVDEARIKAMDEGSAKTIAEMELNFEKEMQAIDRQKEDALRKKIENARSVWEADPKNKGKSFDVTGIKLSDDEQKYFDELYKAAIADNEKTYSNLAYKYQSYTDERLAIEKKFNDDIAVLQEARKKAVEKGDTNEVAKIDRSIAKATVDKGKELMSHDFDVLKKSPEYVRAFEDLKNTSSETLSSLLEQLENAKQTAAETLNPEDLREYTTTIQEIMDELDSRNPFQALADRQKELAEAEKELAEAKKQLDAVNRGAKIVTGVKSISLGADGKIKIENTYLTATEALAKYNAAKDKSQKANNNFIKAEKTAREKVDELADAIKGIGDAIGGQAGEIISLMGDVALFATGTIDGISKVAQTGANAISAVEKASVILGIISTAIQLLQKISELGNNKAFKQYEEYAEKVKEINALTDAVNEYRVAALEAQQAEANWFSKDNLRNLRDYKALHDEVAKAYADKAMESQAVYQNQSGGGWLTGAFNWVMGNLSALSWWNKWKNIWGQGDYDKGQTAAINNLRIETRKKSKGFLGTGIGGKSQKTEDLVTWAKKQGLGDLFDDEGLLNKELAQSLIDNYGNKLVGQTKETLESLIKLREQYDEYIEQLHEYVSSLYEPLVDNFVDSLWDWFDNGKDALDSFKDYASDTFRNIVSDMMRTIVLEKVVGTFSDDIAALYEEYAKGAINEAELMKKVAERTNGLVDNYEQNIPTLQNIMEQVNGYLQNAGIDLKQSESSSQSSTSRGFQAMSQDTGEELKGRFTALQIAGEEIKNQAIEQTGLLSSINEKMSLLDLTNEDIPRLMANVPDIAGQTRESIASGYQPQITINFPTDKIESLASDVSSLKGIVDELRTNQIEKFNDVVEGVSKMAKNTPVMNKKIDSINDNIKKAL